MKKTALFTTLAVSLSLIACEAITIPDFPLPGSGTAPSPSTSPSDPEPTGTPIPAPRETPIPEATRTPNATPTPTATPTATSSASAAIPSSVLVKGLGKDLYYIFDMQGQRVEENFTNRAEELTPGNYQISVGGSSSAYQRQPITVSADQQTVLSAGSLMVTGFGDDLYYIFNELGQQVDSKFTSSPKELLPGNYQVRLGGNGDNSPRQSLVVEAEKQTTLASGSLLVTGDGSQQYRVYNDKIQYMTSRSLNRAMELLPGTYQVRLSVSDPKYYSGEKLITIQANQQTRLESQEIGIYTLSSPIPFKTAVPVPMPTPTCPPILTSPCSHQTR